MKTRPLFLPLLGALTLLGTTACTPTLATRGNIVEDFRLQELHLGASRADVIQSIGSPTAQDPFDPNTWYYLGQRTEKVGIFDPKVVEEKIVRVRFDGEGKLIEAAPLQTTRNDVPITARTTPTSGNEITVIQQMMGNLGKFNKAQKSSPTSVGD